MASLPRLFNRSAESQLIKQGRLSGPMPWVIAIMVSLTVIAAAAGLAFSNAAGSASDALSGGVTVQIVDANPPERDRQAQAALAALRAAPGVVEANLVAQDKIDRLIEPWIGQPVAGNDAIPVPALIDARMRDAVSGETLGALRRILRAAAPAARVDAQSGWLKPVFGAVDTLRWLAIAMVTVLGFALASAVLLAVRSALGGNRDTIEIIHLLGGTDAQIARMFQRSMGFDAAVGGLIGLALGLGVVV
ncbi:MAG: cell division protein, partial [Novosphingobium sp.]|uniref:cell division protein FtsX n=1 Tax=Novosphingobium sp. TaxID=1874826 RepID=UPI0032BCA4CE